MRSTLERVRTRVSAEDGASVAIDEVEQVCQAAG